MLGNINIYKIKNNGLSNDCIDFIINIMLLFPTDLW